MEWLMEALKQGFAGFITILLGALLSAAVTVVNMFFTLKSLKKSTSKDLAAAFTKIRALEDQVDDLEYLINRE